MTTSTYSLYARRVACLVVLSALAVAPLVNFKTDAQAPRSSKNPLSASAQKVPSDLRAMIDANRSSDRQATVIVRTVGDLRESDKQIIEQVGGRVTHEFEGIHALLAQLPLARIDELTKQERVEFITPDREVKGSMAAESKLVGIDKLRSAAPSSFGGSYSAVDGTGVGIAILDTGVNPGNKDLKNPALPPAAIKWHDLTGKNVVRLCQRILSLDFGHLLCGRFGG